MRHNKITEEELKNIIGLFRNGSYENVSIAVGIIKGFTIECVHKIFTALYEECLECPDSMISFILTYKSPQRKVCYFGGNGIVEIYYIINENGRQKRVQSIRIDKSIYKTSRINIQLKLGKLLKDYGYTI